MKRQFSIIIVALTMLEALYQCNNSPRPLAGTWNLEQLEINGMVLPAASVKGWQWVFANNGTYEVRFGGNLEKGKYECTEKQLTMKGGDGIKLVYEITKLDSAQLEVSSQGKDNRMRARFGRSR